MEFALPPLDPRPSTLTLLTSIIGMAKKISRFQRFKQDAVPGLNIHMHFKPTAIGEYEIACAELCGLGHYKMHGMVHVVSQEDFDKWLAAREAEKQ